MEMTSYFLVAAAVFVLVGYLIGKGTIPVRPSVVLILIFILALPFLINAFIWFYAGSTPETSTPNVMGLASDRAVEKLRDEGLNGEVIGVSFSKEPSGTVISQQPEAGRRVKTGRTVNLIVSPNLC